MSNVLTEKNLKQAYDAYTQAFQKDTTIAGDKLAAFDAQLRNVIKNVVYDNVTLAEAIRVREAFQQSYRSSCLSRMSDFRKALLSVLPLVTEEQLKSVSPLTSDEAAAVHKIYKRKRDSVGVNEERPYEPDLIAAISDIRPDVKFTQDEVRKIGQRHYIVSMTHEVFQKEINARLAERPGGLKKKDFNEFYLKVKRQRGGGSIFTEELKLILTELGLIGEYTNIP